MENARPKAVLIDDDQFWASTVIRELSKKFEVVFLQNAMEAKDYFENNFDSDGVVLDIMMEAPDGCEGETEDGQLTGIWILQQIRDFVKSADIPVLVLSNHHDMPRVESRLSEFGDLRRHITVQGKYGVSRQELPDLLMSRIRAIKGMSERI